MATTPNYEGTKRSGSVILTDASSTTMTSAVMTGSTSGTRVKEIRVHSTGASAPGSSRLLYVLLDDTTNATVIDIISVTNSTNMRQAVLRYDNVFLPSTGASLKFQMNSALASGSSLHVEVFGSDF